jgi:hypothetical protein
MIWDASAALYAIVAVLAWLIALRRPHHKPVAWFMTVSLTTDVIRQALDRLILAPDRAQIGTVPFTGWARVAFHFDEAFFVLWRAGIIALVVFVFLKVRPWPVVVVYTLTVMVLVFGYPTIRGETLGRIYLGVELATIAVTIGSFTTWFWRREAPTITTFVTLAIGVLEAVTLLPYRKDPFNYWLLAQVSYITFYVALIILYGGILWGSGSSSQSSSR